MRLAFHFLIWKRRNVKTKDNIETQRKKNSIYNRPSRFSLIDLMINTTQKMIPGSFHGPVDTFFFFWSNSLHEGAQEVASKSTSSRCGGSGGGFWLVARCRRCGVTSVTENICLPCNIYPLIMSLVLKTIFVMNSSHFIWVKRRCYSSRDYIIWFLSHRRWCCIGLLLWKMIKRYRYRHKGTLYGNIPFEIYRIRAELPIEIRFETTTRRPSSVRGWAIFPILTHPSPFLFLQRF